MNDRTAVFEILDFLTFDIIGVIDNYTSALWVDRYNECGDFEITCPYSDNFLDICALENYVRYSESEHIMIIENVILSMSDSGEMEYKISGRSLESILYRRILPMTTVFNGSLEVSLKQILNLHYGASGYLNTFILHTKIDNFEFRDSGNTDISSLTVNMSFDENDDLYDVITSICKSANLGFKMSIEKSYERELTTYSYNKAANRYETTDYVIYFQLTKGDDHSYQQENYMELAGNNPYVIFSNAYGNLENFTFTKTTEDLKNNIMVSSGDDRSNALSRRLPENRDRLNMYNGPFQRDVWEKASDITKEVQKPDGSTYTLSWSEFNALVMSRIDAIANATDIKTKIEAKIIDGVVFTYGVDYKLGDIVQVESPDGQFSGAYRISEFIYSFDPNGIEFYPTLTDPNE